MRNNRLMTGAICAVLLGAMTTFHVYCDTTGSAALSGTESLTAIVTEASEIDSDSKGSTGAASESSSSNASTQTAAGVNAGSGQSALDTSDLFSDRDLEQTADLAGAEHITVADGETYTVKTEGVYVVSGTAANAQIIVEAGDEDKVQLVLDGVSITNDSTPAIYVKNADKVFVTTTDSENALTVSGTFTADGTTNTDAVIFSRDDLVLNGTGSLSISSTENGISGKDDLKITGGTITITCSADALEANESILVADGTVNITTEKDGLHAENDEDSTTGYIYIGGGTLTVNAGDDAVHATTIVQVDGGTLDLTAREGLEGTYIQVNDGSVSIAASDDGINAGQKSNVCTPTFEINGGTVTVTMGSGDTDAIDSNGNLVLNGGTLDITAQSPFDYDGSVQSNGTKLIVNGTETTQITNQMMGGGMGGRGMDGGSGIGNGEMQGNFKQGGAAGDFSGSSIPDRNERGFEKGLPGAMPGRPGF